MVQYSLNGTNYISYRKIFFNKIVESKRKKGKVSTKSNCFLQILLYEEGFTFIFYFDIFRTIKINLEEVYI